MRGALDLTFQLDARRMDNLVRREIIADARTFVIKIGTNVLSRDDDTIDADRIAQIAEQIHRVRETGRQVVVVSSGAIGAGMGLLGLKTRPTDLPHLQAAAAAGQAHLIRLYDDCLRKHGYHAAQVLLTANDFKSRTRYLNVRNTLHTLFEYKAIPIVNENDTVSVAEIKFGDNDQLAAMVTGLLSDPLLIILSIVDGLDAGEAGGGAHCDGRWRERDHRERHASRSARRDSRRAGSRHALSREGQGFTGLEALDRFHGSTERAFYSRRGGPPRRRNPRQIALGHWHHCRGGRVCQGRGRL